MKPYLIILILLLAAAAVQARDATVLYFNDAHQLSPIDDRLGDRGGVARLKSVIDSVKTQHPEALVIFGGDLGGGLLFGVMFHGLPMVEAMNLIPVDLANFGQHDFDFGAEETRRLVADSEFPWLSSNLVEPDGRPFADVAPFLIKNVGNLHIGFLGLTDGMNMTLPDSSVIQLDLFAAARSAVDSLLTRGVDTIIALSQSRPPYNDELMRQFPEIDIILAEEIFEYQTNVKYVENRPIVSPCGNIGSVVQLDLWRDRDRIRQSIQVHPVNDSVTGDPVLADLQTTYSILMEGYLSDTLTVLETDLDAGINTHFRCRWTETNVGNFLTDAYRDYYGADIVLLNGGGIRANVAAGPFTLREALSIIPFNNTICLTKMPGAVIRQALAHAVSQVALHKGQFLQVSGLSYRYDWVKSGPERLLRVEVAGEPLNPDRMYTVALPNFILNGGDGFTMFDTVEVLVNSQEARTDIEILVEYCRQFARIAPVMDGRIQVENEPDQ